MTLMLKEELYRIAWKKFGQDAQILMAIEEMAELTKLFCHISRQRTTYDDIAEEIADVAIMMEQIIQAFKIKEEVAECKAKKLIRLRYKIKGV